MHDLTLIPAAQGVGLVPLSNRVHDYVRASRSDNTRRAYASDLRHFEAWTETRGLEPLPAAPATVAEYLADHADELKPSTLQRRLVAISQAHSLAGLLNPTTSATVREVMKGIRRTRGTAKNKKAALTTPQLQWVVAALPDSIAGRRDRALLLLGFAGALRRSEIAALDVADLADHAEGLVINLRRSKTDQEGEGRLIGLPHGSHPETCPVLAVRDWLERAGITAGPVLRAVDRHGNIADGRLSGEAVARIVKRSVARAGLDPARFAGHSLRAGFATSAAAAGASERAIMDQTGHRSLVVLRGYIREGSLFVGNAAGAVGL